MVELFQHEAGPDVSAHPQLDGQAGPVSLSRANSGILPPDSDDENPLRPLDPHHTLRHPYHVPGSLKPVAVTIAEEKGTNPLRQFWMASLGANV